MLDGDLRSLRTMNSHLLVVSGVSTCLMMGKLRRIHGFVVMLQRCVFAASQQSEDELAHTDDENIGNS